MLRNLNEVQSYAEFHIYTFSYKFHHNYYIKCFKQNCLDMLLISATYSSIDRLF
jgi:hypothetical protein